jgi:energy-coupling factor transporter ATP-binding protein EcfA2
MLASIAIENFRGIREGRLEDFTPLVVLVGPNGSGKSTVLDAILIGANPNPGVGIGQTVLRREELSSGAPWLLWKRGTDGPATIRIALRTSLTRISTLEVQPSLDPLTVKCTTRDARGELGRQPQQVSVTFSTDNTPTLSGPSSPLEGNPEVVFVGPFPKTRLAPLHQLYSELVLRGKRDEVTAILGALVPGLQGVEILVENQNPVLNLVYRDRAVPAVLAGDGIKLLLRLGFELTIRSGGIALLEEPEVHAHPAAIRQGAKAVVAAVRRNVQVFLTTHSLEVIDSLLSEASLTKDIEKLSLYRLQLQDGLLKSSRLPGPEVAFARGTIEDDLR